MTRHFPKVIIIFLLFSCSQNTNKRNKSTATINKQKDTLKTNNNENWFSNLREVIDDTTTTYWATLQGEYTTVLYFNKEYKDTLQIEYHGQCWYSYPLKIEKDKIVVFWDDNKDCVFDIGFAEPIKDATKPEKG